MVENITGQRRKKKRRRTDKLWGNRHKHVKTLRWAPTAHQGRFPAGRLPLCDPVPNHMWSDPGGKHEPRRTLFCQEFRKEKKGRKTCTDCVWLELEHIKEQLCAPTSACSVGWVAEKASQLRKKKKAKPRGQGALQNTFIFQVPMSSSISTLGFWEKSLHS